VGWAGGERERESERARERESERGERERGERERGERETTGYDPFDQQVTSPWTALGPVRGRVARG